MIDMLSIQLLAAAAAAAAVVAGGIGAPRTPSGCAASALKLDMAAEEANKLQVRH
jgi:hypothetical protein